MGRESTWKVSIKSLSAELRESHRRGRKSVRPKRDQYTRRTKPPESINQDTHELTETEAANIGVLKVHLLVWPVTWVSFLFKRQAPSTPNLPAPAEASCLSPPL